LHDGELPVSLLKQAKLVITTTTLDGISTTREVKDLKFDASKVLVHKLPVPERLAMPECDLERRSRTTREGW
jgi:hypothetical protein